MRDDEVAIHRELEFLRQAARVNGRRPPGKIHKARKRLSERARKMAATPVKRS